MHMIHMKFRENFECQKYITVVTHKSDTSNSDTYPNICTDSNSETLFAFTKISLFWEEEDFGKYTLIFYKH